MTLDHERIEELLAAESLGGLDGSGVEELRGLRMAHGADCSECLRIEGDYREVAGRLAFAVAPEPVAPELEERVLRETEHLRQGPGSPFVRVGRTMDLLLRLGGRGVAVAAAALVLLGGLGGYLLTGPGGPGDLRVARFEGSAPGSLALVYEPGADEAVVLGAGLEELPAGSVYQLWLVDEDGPAPAGTFEDEGGGLVVVRLEADPSEAGTMAVTVEEAPGVAQPTSDPVFVVDVA
ncbi:MAG: anti-sigma factor [Actinobacteria bacterium]|nr:anti-sigma factor [Actinomycetota bacterium]